MIGNQGERAAVVGGGFFGCYLALQLKRKGLEVHLIEAEHQLMSRASYVNQARVHGGYHYPRSILTAMRSRESFARFSSEFSDCITSNFESYYLIASRRSHVTARQFEIFCDRIGAPYWRARPDIKALTNQALIEDIFETEEYCFDAVKLKKVMEKLLLNSGVIIHTGTTFSALKVNGPNNLDLKLTCGADAVSLSQCAHVFNCTYSSINKVNELAALPLIPLRHQITEVTLVHAPDAMQGRAFTVMDGPFFSVIPFPAQNCYSLTHVRYTPHYQWTDGSTQENPKSEGLLSEFKGRTAFSAMAKDASRYLPLLGRLTYVDSLWDIKTILPNIDRTDSRPILFKANHGVIGFHCVMGGKIDNVYDVITEIEASNLIRPRNET